MRRKKEAIREKKDQKFWFLASCLAFSVICVLAAIFRGTLHTFHSDDAIAVLLAREQLHSGWLIPPDWSYAYEYWILSLNLLVLPFLKLTGQMLLSRQLAVMVQFFLLQIVFYRFLKRLVSRNGALLGCIFLTAPLSFIHMEHFYFQATYATTILWSFVILLLLFAFLERKTLKSELPCAIALGALIIALGCGGTRTLGTVLLPAAAGMGIVVLMECDYRIPALLQKRRLLVKAGFVGLAMVLGILAGNRLLALGQTQGSQAMVICKTSDFFSNFAAFFTSFLQVYGCFEAETLMSATGILGVLKLLLAVFCGMVVPVSLLAVFGKLTKAQKFYVGYSVCVFLVIFYMMVFCELKNAYYFLPVYVNNVVLTCMFIEYFREPAAKTFQKILDLAVPGFLIPLALLSCVVYGKYNYASVERWAGFDTVDLGLMEFLKQEGLEFGYSDFFNAQCYTVASNGAVEIVSVNEEYGWNEEEERFVAYVRHPSHARQWLSSKRWYQEGYHDGGSFVMTRTEFLNELSSAFLENAVRTLTYGKYTILVYEESMANCRWE